MSGKDQLPPASRHQKGKLPAYQPFSHALQSSGAAPEIQIDGPEATQNLDDFSIGSHPERSLPIVPTAPSSRSLGGSATSSLHRITKWFGKWSSPNRRHKSPPSHPEPSVANIRLHPAPDTSRLSHLYPEQNVDGNRRSPSSIQTVADTTSSLHSQLERMGLDSDVPSLSEVTALSSAPASDRKKPVIIGTTKLLLQVGAFALKASPIPLLGEIPNLLLKFLQVYESVDSNSENLKGLNDDVHKAYTTILRPLQLWTDNIPPEVTVLIKEFHSALNEQMKKIEELSRQKLPRRLLSVSDVTQHIDAVKACINKAVISFSTEAAILTLLHKIQSSVRDRFFWRWQFLVVSWFNFPTRAPSAPIHFGLASPGTHCVWQPLS
ncbi:uncharacterized protein EI90DRAFT_2367057 [Cantharellus anzutake]|uniref:uncharacterized protein n=1 Tax=Cantharellus anzutake TaxID=1750568 RepID=UPI001907769D|nr:uncharacterized protein EI90DRAFT_2367057 [Cantharellus anzutake]KAF8324202.1 hypothetical protein EI90DRAFT_2367057 [Cantharellus anzutake]